MSTVALRSLAVLVVAVVAVVAVHAQASETYERPETRQLVSLVEGAAQLLARAGEAAFGELATEGSRWRHDDTYVFVLQDDGRMWVHPDAALRQGNQMGLRDVRGRPIVRGLIDATRRQPDKPWGWFHYEWPVPNGLLPRWKSTYVRRVTAPSGETYVVGAGVYDDRMERAFATELVDDAVALVEQHGTEAFAALRDPTGPFVVKDTYVFVIDPAGTDLVNPGFANLEGRSLLDLKDARGKRPVREMLAVVRGAGAGWIDYQWPKPGDNVPTTKSAWVRKAKVGRDWLMVGCGVYQNDAAKRPRNGQTMTASQLMQLVRDGAALLEAKGELAYPEFRRKGSKWLHHDTYLFVWNLDGTRAFHGADPSLEGQNGSRAQDILGRPYGRMFLAVADLPEGEGWVHYLYPEPGDLFPAWKSAFLKRVTLPSGRQQLLGCGAYHMQMAPALVQDVVNQAATLLASQGRQAFAALRDRTGPFVFMDIYVFVDAPDGTELVNPGQPSLEGRNLINHRDIHGKAVAREYIAKALADGSAWVDYVWYRPGDNRPVAKRTYVRSVQVGGETFIVGAGLYIE